MYKDYVKRFNNGISELKGEINMLKNLHETSNDTRLSTLESKIDKLFEKLDAHSANCQPKRQKTNTKKPDSKKKDLDPQSQPIDEASTKDNKAPKKSTKKPGKGPLQSTNASKVEKTPHNRRKQNKTVIKQEENGTVYTCARRKKKALAADNVINDLESEFETEALKLYNELNTSVVPLNGDGMPADIGGGSDQRRMLLNTYSSSPNYSESDNEPENTSTSEKRLVSLHAS